MNSALRAAILKIPTREERLGGQTFKYVKLSEILDLIDCSAVETPAPQLPTLTDAQREVATERVATIIKVSMALEKKTPKELVDLVLGELAAMDVSSIQELLIEELCTRVHPNWCNEVPDSEVKASAQCPSCNSPDPKRHPATAFEGEVSLCEDPWHKPTAAEIRSAENGTVKL